MMSVKNYLETAESALAAAMAAINSARNATIDTPQPSAIVINWWRDEWYKYSKEHVGNVLAAWVVYDKNRKTIILITTTGIVWVCEIINLLNDIADNADSVCVYHYVGSGLTQDAANIASTVSTLKIFDVMCAASTHGTRLKATAIIDFAKILAGAVQSSAVFSSPDTHQQ
jgi:hypothetical protein